MGDSCQRPGPPLPAALRAIHASALSVAEAPVLQWTMRRGPKVSRGLTSIAPSPMGFAFCLGKTFLGASQALLVGEEGCGDAESNGAARQALSFAISDRRLAFLQDVLSGDPNTLSFSALLHLEPTRSLPLSQLCSVLSLHCATLSGLKRRDRRRRRKS